MKKSKKLSKKLSFEKFQISNLSVIKGGDGDDGVKSGFPGCPESQTKTTNE